MEINLLSLHKKLIVLEAMYVLHSVTNGEPLHKLQGLTTEEGYAIKDCFKKFIDLVMVYHDTAQVPWIEKSQKEMGESSWTAEQRNPQGLDGRTVRDGHAEQEMNRLGVRNEGNEEQDAQEASSQDSNDFDIIV